MWLFLLGLIFACAIVFFSSRYFYDRRIAALVHSRHLDQDQFLQQLNSFQMDQEKLEAILSSMVEGVIVINADGKVEHASQNFCRMLELRSKETRGRLYWEVIWNQEINDSLREALLQKKAVKKEIHIIGSQGSCFSMQISPVMDKNHRLLSLIAIFHDISELKKLENMRTEFVANVSHELKTPLTAIKGFVETLRSSTQDDPKTTAHFLNIIDKQTQRLESLVNDLLILSAIESKEVKMNVSLESLNKIIHSILALQKQSIEDKGHQVSVDIPVNLPKILVDRARIEQVFLNLLDNAIKFTPAKGQVRISAQLEAPYLRVNIKDSGVGIAPEHLSRVFERFYRVDKARARDGAGGTGLGLSIVHQIISAHQGKIEVESSPGQGSTFHVFLPYQA